MLNKFNNLFFQRKKPLLLDGAMGTLLLSLDVPYDKHLWTSLAAITRPNLLADVHNEYIHSGADIITTNTFRTNPLSVLESKYSSELLVKSNIQIALECRGDKPILIAGSNASAEDCYQAERTISAKDIQYNHQKHISLLMENGADFILNETQSHYDELKVISAYCSNSNIPYGISLFFNNSNRILSGNLISETIEMLNDYNPLFISFNCINFEVFTEFFKMADLNFNWGCYLNCGQSEQESGKIGNIISPEEYFEKSKMFFEKCPVIVGTCCGSTPNHTKFLREGIDEYYKN